MCSELAREKMWSRIHLIPLLQAEEDRDQVRRHFADQAREKELLGTETSPYHSDRYANYLYDSSFHLRSWGMTNGVVADSSARASHIPPATSLNSELEKLKYKRTNPQENALQESSICCPQCTQLYPCFICYNYLQLFDCRKQEM